MMKPNWPISEKIHLKNLHVPSPLLDSRFANIPALDGVALIDLVIADGRISDVLHPDSELQMPTYDADGGQLWPPFADLHTHMDKGQIWPRAGNATGTLELARATVRADTASRWTAEDVEARFEFALQCAFAYGTAAIRTHIDCLVLGQAEISFGVFRRMRERWAGRITLQATALVGPDLYDGPENAAIVDIIVESEARLGGVACRLTDQEDPAILAQRFNRLFALASSRGLDVDLHVDETGMSSSFTLCLIAEAVLRSDFKGQVVCGHCCSLSVLNDALAEKTIRLVAEAGITVVSLPLVNQFLQGRRPDGTPRWRGITLLRELRAAGVNVALASDNCRDPYHPFGDLDLLEVYGGGIKIGHLHDVMGEWTKSVTSIPSAIMGVTDFGKIKAGASADFQIFRGRSFSELLARHQSDRLVVRNGKAIDTTLPDYRQLDALMRPTTLEQA